MGDLDQNIVGTVGVVIVDSHNQYAIHNISEQEEQTGTHADLKEVSLVIDTVVLFPDSVNVMNNFADATHTSITIDDSRICTVDKASNKPFFSLLNPTQDKALDNSFAAYSQDFLHFLYNTYVSVNEFLKQHDPFPNFLVIPGVAAQRGAARAAASTSATQRGSSSRYRTSSFDSSSLPAPANYNIPPAANSNFRAPVFPGDAPPIRFSTQRTTPSTFPMSTPSTAYYPTNGMGMVRQFHEPASIFSPTNYPSYQYPGLSFPSSKPFSSSSSLSSYPSSSSFPSYSITPKLPTLSFSSYSPLSSFSVVQHLGSTPSTAYSLGEPTDFSSHFRPLSEIYYIPLPTKEIFPEFLHVSLPEVLQIQGLTLEDSNHLREWKVARHKFYMQRIQWALKQTYRILFINCIPIDEEYIKNILRKVDLAVIENALASGFVLNTLASQADSELYIQRMKYRQEVVNENYANYQAWFLYQELIEQRQRAKYKAEEHANAKRSAAGASNGGNGGNSTGSDNIDEVAKAAKTEDAPSDSAQQGISHLPQLRQEYIKEVRGLTEVVDKLRNQGKTPEEIARIVSNMRRDLGIKYKDMTPPELRDIYYKANIKEYGDPLGPTVEHLRSEGKTWEEIIASACREGGRGLPGTKI
ncbi:MAG: hypothetical protein KBC27_00175 [Rickettsiales bacterium]|nr:hypothetical protein [Rickettsiales bacterium]